MSLTVPQIVMLNHEAWVRHERQDRKWKRKREADERDQQTAELSSDQEVWHGKKLKEMNSKEWGAYYGGFFSGAE